MTRRALAPQWQQLLQRAYIDLIPASTGHELAGMACAWGAAGIAPQKDVVDLHGARVMALLPSISGQVHGVGFLGGGSVWGVL